MWRIGGMCVLLRLPIGGNKCQMPSTPGVLAITLQIKCHKQTYNNTWVLFFGAYWSDVSYVLESQWRASLNAVKPTDCFHFPNAHWRFPAGNWSALIHHPESDLISGAWTGNRYVLWMLETQCKYLGDFEENIFRTLSLNCQVIPVFYNQMPLINKRVA